MSFTKLHELNQTLSQYLLDTFSIDIPDPVTLTIFFGLYLFVIIAALLAINETLKDSYMDSKDQTMFFYRLVPFLGMFSIYLVTSKIDTLESASLNLFTGIAIIICLLLELAFQSLRLFVKYTSTSENRGEK